MLVGAITLLRRNRHWLGKNVTDKIRSAEREYGCGYGYGWMKGCGWLKWVDVGENIKTGRGVKMWGEGGGGEKGGEILIFTQEMRGFREERDKEKSIVHGCGVLWLW